MTTTTTAPPSVGFGRRPLSSLAVAEYRQFIRNKTLVVMGTLFPVAIPLATFFIARNNSGATVGVATTGLEMFALMALLFVMYYSVLSMVTTRRGEGVLKRLRTGEAADWQIQVAPAVPGALLTLIGAVIVGGVIYGAGSPVPVNAIVLVLALLGGIIVFSLLALATSAVTKNAEAAQITSLPVMIIAMVGQDSIRNLLPDRLGSVVDWTPFAALSDLISLGSAGLPATAPEGAVAANFMGTFAEMGQPLATLGLWTLLTLWIVKTSFRWDDRG
ncbi:ABC transporter [Rhodococcus sp. WWJCD1]|uniref:ABC transporter permease n=1 Tax=unclassified Rhodococcus (in: high G+C Gram-positive bacteria) TaxID=192944 RepID=UPI000B9ABD87|nr:MULTISPECIES: ABC transporter permease [unclassified Rhodococcus (in: high G+C Gram-positive bacteria)]OZC44417.1 ABC transporter [Rhodococcus sp. WWJCD1]OZE74198.1 ABC transporter [Rhodococcus sp. 15-649-2-2]